MSSPDEATPADDVTWVDDEETLRSTRAPRPLGELLSSLSDRRRWGPRLEAAGIFSKWEEIVGPDLARRCEPVRLAGGILVVRAENHAWATQVTYLERDILRRSDETLRPGLVREVKVTVGVLEGTARTRS